MKTLLVYIVILGLVGLGATDDNVPGNATKTDNGTSIVANKRSENKSEVVVNRRTVRLLDETKDLTQRHPDQLNLVLRDEDGNDVRLRMRRDLTPDISFEGDDGVIGTLSLREADEDAMYSAEDGGQVMVRSVETGTGRFKRLMLTGSFINGKTAYVIEPSLPPASRKRDVEDEKHFLIKRFDMPTSKQGSRQKRSHENLGVELALVIDYHIFNMFYSENNNDQRTALMEIRRYYAHIMSGVDMRYANLRENDFSIYIRVVRIHVITSIGQSSFSSSREVVHQGVRDEKMINGEKALNELQNWDRTRNLLEQSDHVMAFTTKDLYSLRPDRGYAEMEKIIVNGRRMVVDTGTIGVAFTRSTCGRDSYSIVEEDGVFTSEGTAAHELAHSLGARYHDGDGQARRCASDASYIMAPINVRNVEHWNYMNPYRFSECSVEQFRNYFSQLRQRNCLLNRANHMSGWHNPNTKPGQIKDARAQCQAAIGPNSDICPFMPIDDICRGMYCTLDDGACSNSRIPARGTSCGDRKWCENGQCVSHPDAPAFDAKCPTGDATSGVNGRSCSDVIRSDPSQCYNSRVYSACCGTCKERKDEHNQGCEYGDHHSFCSTLTDGQCGVAWNNWRCGCERCSRLSVSSSQCRDTNYRQCQQYVTSATKYNCYKTDVRDSCCASCNRHANKRNPGCLFGDDGSKSFYSDYGHYTCSTLSRSNEEFRKAECEFAEVRETCCETCQGV